MTNNTTAKRFIERLKTHQSPVEREKTLRYFKTPANGEIDQFIGVRMGQVFALAKEFITMTPDEIEKLPESDPSYPRLINHGLHGKKPEYA